MRNVYFYSNKETECYHTDFPYIEYFDGLYDLPVNEGKESEDTENLTFQTERLRVKNINLRGFGVNKELLHLIDKCKLIPLTVENLESTYRNNVDVSFDYVLSPELDQLFNVLLKYETVIQNEKILHLESHSRSLEIDILNIKKRHIDKIARLECKIDFLKRPWYVKVKDWFFSEIGF